MDIIKELERVENLDLYAPWLTQDFIADIHYGYDFYIELYFVHFNKQGYLPFILNNRKLIVSNYRKKFGVPSHNSSMQHYIQIIKMQKEGKNPICDIFPKH